MNFCDGETVNYEGDVFELQDELQMLKKQVQIRNLVMQELRSEVETLQKENISNIRKVKKIKTQKLRN